MSTVKRARKQAPKKVADAETFADGVDSDLKRFRKTSVAPLKFAEKFENPQASSTKIRSGFVTQPGSLMAKSKGEGRRKKGFAEKHANLYSRLSGKPESKRSRNSDIIKALGLQGVPKLLMAKPDTARMHEATQDRLRKARYEAATSQSWGPVPTGMTEAEWRAHQKKIAEDRGVVGAKPEDFKISGFGRKKNKRKKRK